MSNMLPSVSYNGNPRGSLWHKWDLHIHTPASVIQHFGDSTQNETWEQYIDALESLPTEIKAIGINDYFFIDGYRRVIEAKKKGRLKNLELILPVIELRIASFAGHKQLRKINYHVIFSDNLTPDQIEDFFLKELGGIELRLDNGKTWQGRVWHRRGLIELGKAIKSSVPESKRPRESDLLVGFNNAAFPLEKIREAIKQSIFDTKVVTAVGLAEWDQMRWDGGSSAIKKDIINSADLVFTASPSPVKYQERREQLREQQVNTHLLDCSDAHYYASSEQPNRLGNVFSWLKADLTFQGLRRVVQQFDDRVFVGNVGEMPPKLERIQQHKMKYIRSIEIRKKDKSKLDEIWFDCEILINPDFVAIIGNQGNGKSALTDILALCGNAKVDEFSFLNKDKFRDKQNKAREFEAILTWEDGTQLKRSLDETVNDSELERVRYVPQHFFENVTNETIVREGGRFYGEIKKAIFSHIPESDRLGCSDFDSLIELRTREDQRGLDALRQELKSINTEIVLLEKQCSPEKKEILENKIVAKLTEIETHKSNKPDPPRVSQSKSRKNKQIDSLRRQEKKIRRQIDETKTELGKYKKRREFLLQKKTAVENEYQRIRSFLDALQFEFEEESIEIESKQLLTVSIDVAHLEKYINDIEEQIENAEQKLVPELPNSLVQELEEKSKQRKKLQDELKKEDREYQVYENRLAEWQDRFTELQGDADKVESLIWLKQQLQDITIEKPKKLKQLEGKRQAKSEEIHQKLKRIASIYQELTERVKVHIQNTPLTNEKYKIQFDIGLVESDMADQLFGIIGQTTGTFGGVQEGRERLQNMINQCDFDSAEKSVAFAYDILDKLKNNYRNSPPSPIELSKLLKKGHSEGELYDFLFGFQYLSPQYSLALNGKPLKQLSPGERGILLLIFYLVVDRSEEPLIIDQPEGNLNNQSIFQNLVPVFKEAKSNRQIIIVTHNPNLAVVCDAEQIIHAQIDFHNKNRVIFRSGALENPIFNKISLDVLEGTLPAFETRQSTYKTLFHV